MFLKKEGNSEALLLQAASLKQRVINRNSVEGEKLMEEIFLLRSEVYRQIGWIIGDGATHMVKDHFDDLPFTNHFAILEEGKLVGSHRMTKYSHSFRLPYIGGGNDPGLFRLDEKKACEANRLLIRQDRKYPGCAKQLLFNTTKYELENRADYIISIGFSVHIGFFSYVGYLPVNEEMDCILDEKNGEKVVRKGIPIVATKMSLNPNIELCFGAYDREFVVIKNG